MSATPAASIPFCAATNPNATRNPSNPTRKLPGGHARANATRSAPISNPASNNAARLANRSQRDASIIVGCAGASIPTSSRAAQNRSKTRRSASTSSRVASRATKSGRDATKSGRDADTGRGTGTRFSFSRVSVSQRGAEVSRAVREGQLVLALVDVGDVSSFAVERRESRREENRGGVESEVIEPAPPRPTTRRARPPERTRDGPNPRIETPRGESESTRIRAMRIPRAGGRATVASRETRRTNTTTSPSPSVPSRRESRRRRRAPPTDRA